MNDEARLSEAERKAEQLLREIAELRALVKLLLQKGAAG